MVKSGLEIRLDDKMLREIIQKHPQRVEDWLDGVAETIVGDIKLSLGTSPPGRKYRRGSKYHVASQAGNPPNVDTGALRESLHWNKQGQNTRHIMDGVEYGIHLETKAPSEGGRPFVGPVFDDWGGKLADDAKKNLKIE